MIENLETFPSVVIIFLLGLAGLFAWVQVRIVQNQLWADLRQVYREGGWEGVREFFLTGTIPYPKQ